MSIRPTIEKRTWELRGTPRFEAEGTNRDSGDPVVGGDTARDHGDGLADHVLTTEQPPGLALGEDDVAGLGQRRHRIALDERKLQHVEEQAVDQQHVLGRQGLAAAHHDRLAAQCEDRSLDLR